MSNSTSWLGKTLQQLRDRLRALSKNRPELSKMKGTPDIAAIAVEARANVTVVIPALNEARRIAEVVAYALADPATAEVIVIDDSSIDSTAELARLAGARVMRSSMLGKGASMHDGVAPAQCAVLVYLDGDLAGLRSGIISDLATPVLRGEADFVKARFGRAGGRVTELTAKPMLKIFFPELAHFAQPLGGIIAARKTLLQALSFEDGYGVDVGLLLDAHLAGARLAEVDIGSLEHDSQPLHDLTLMANEVGRVIFGRARVAGRLHVEQVAAMYESQRQAAGSIEYVLTRRRARRSLLLLEMDGVLSPSRFAVELARLTGHEEALRQVMADGDAATRHERIAGLFQYVHRKKFEEVARTMEIRPEAIEFVNQMRRRGFMVGVISDSYFVAAEIIRRRVFADFAMAHTLNFDNDVCSGEVRINPAWLPDQPAKDVTIGKSNVLRKFLSDESTPPIAMTWVVGDGLEDHGILRLADQAFAFAPVAPALAAEQHFVQITSFGELMLLLPDHELVERAAA